MSVPSGIIHFETGDALPGVVVGYVSIRSQGGVSFLDASTYAAAGLAVAALAAIAASLPALRAARIDPVTALRVG